GLPPKNTKLPTISGTAKQGQTLIATRGSWNNYPTSYTYQWQHCNSSGASCSSISSATASAYTLVLADVGHTLRLVVTGKNAYGSASATSARYPASGTVIGLPPGAFAKTSPANGATGQPNTPSLSWGTSSDAASYEYCIDTTNNNACDGSWVSTSAATSASLSGLTLGTTYYWQVQAINAQGTTAADGGSWFSFAVSGPQAGHWVDTSLSGDYGTVTSVIFDVWSDGVTEAVSGFGFVYDYSNGIGCYGLGVSSTIEKGALIVGGQFQTPAGMSSWWESIGNQAPATGVFNGTFDSPTSAHGTAKMIGSISCGFPSGFPITTGTFSWTATLTS
ncbi:MAG: hypothetical protein ABSC51_12265, partial [Gaiellaceae bacterium]